MQEIDVHEAMRRIDAGARLIDVREQDEWDRGHAPTATLLPMSELASRWTEVAVQDDPAIIVCHAGHRSASVTDALERAGVPAVSLAGGMIAWAEAGGVVVLDHQQPAADREPAAGQEHSAAGEPAEDR